MKYKILHCKQCDKRFESIRKKKYCSKRCSYKSRRKTYRKACNYCGLSYVTGHKHQKFCSNKCSVSSQASKREPLIITCLQCKKTYKPKAPNRKTFCSRECYQSWCRAPEGKATIGKASKKVVTSRPYYGLWKCKDRTWKLCKCGQVVSPFSRYRLCDGCRCADRYCKCGTVISRKYARWCNECVSEKRTAAVQKAKALSRVYKKERKAKIKVRREGIVSVPILRQRDGDKCSHCGKRMRFSGDTNHDLYRSIDHIVPLACGGNHSPQNTQLAHRACNSNRGISSTQMRLW